MLAASRTQRLPALFVSTAWIRLTQETFAELQRYKSAQQCPTWDTAVMRLVDGRAASK
jgi:hypothetical protein